MIFNQNILKLHREYARRNIHESDFLIEHATADIIENIELLNFNPQNILEIEPRAGHLSRKLSKQYAQITCAEADDMPNQKFDLIASSMYFHWVEKVENFLRQIHSMLTEDGRLVLNFVASGSLDHLKKFLLQCEIEGGVGHSPHIMPFPQEEKVQTMFQQCGFKFVIVSTEKIELEYVSPIKLMKDLKNMGENNAFSGQIVPLPRNVFEHKAQPFHDIINMVTVVAGR
jgi:hypothetical protein